MKDKLNVLVLEDNPSDAELMAGELHHAGFEFDWKRVDTEAGYLEQLDRVPDVILADYSLPQFNAIRALQQLHERNLDIPFLIVTGAMGDEATAECMRQGASDYLLKDRLARLGPAVERALAEKKLRDEKRQAQNQLRESERCFRALIENSSDAIVLLTRTGRIRYVSPSTLRLLGYTKNEAMGRHAFANVHPNHLEPIRGRFAQLTREPDTHATMQFLYRHKNGTWRWIEAVATNQLHDPFIGAVIVNFRDTTDRKRAEEKLKVMNEMLELRIFERTHELAEKNEQIEIDLEMARELQRAILPQEYPTFPGHAAPEHSALRFHADYYPSGSVGGDFFAVDALSDTLASIFICDVMGRGVRSALITALVRGLVEELRSSAADPGQFLTKVNHGLLAVLKQTRTPMFVSAFHMVVDTARGEARYATAGHPMPFHLQRNAEIVKPLTIEESAVGPALGLFDEPVYATKCSTLAEGDVVLLFTDGLYEVEGADATELGRGRLLDVVRKRMHLPLQEMLQEVLNEAKQHSTRKDFADDVCLLATEVIRVGVTDPARVDRAHGKERELHHEQSPASTRG